MFQGREREVVANLAAGRVLVYVARDAIVIGLAENRIEPEAHLPLLTPLARGRVGVLLGAEEWSTPEGGEPLRLQEELARLSGEIAGPRRLQAEHEEDLQAIGLALHEPLYNAAGHLHRKIDLPPDEPLLELLLIGYLEGYGPEAWSLRYRMVQEPARGDYWRTRVLRPHYTQHYPPERGQRRTLVEFRYPPEPGAAGALEELAASGALDRFRAAGPPLAGGVNMVERGTPTRASADEAVAFIRAALEALAGPENAVAVAVIHEQKGFTWVLPPPDRARRAGRKAEEKAEPGAPTLRRPPQ